MVYSLMNQTLPTIVGMGVLSRTTETMFGKNRGSSRRVLKTAKGTVYLATKSTKLEAERFARKWKQSHPRSTTRITKFQFTGMGKQHTAYNVWAR